MGCIQSTAATTIAEPTKRQGAGTAAPLQPENAIEKFCQAARETGAGQSVQQVQVGRGHGYCDDDATCIWKADTSVPVPLPSLLQSKGPPTSSSQTLKGPPTSSTQTLPPNLSSTQSLPPMLLRTAETPIAFSEKALVPSIYRSKESGSSTSTSPRSGTLTGSVQHVSAGAFPESMTPLDLVSTGFRASDFKFDESVSSSSGLLEWSLRIDALGFAVQRVLAGQFGDSGKERIRGVASAPHHITLSDAELNQLGIVREARLFSFCYPVTTEQPLQISKKDTMTPDIALLAFGGFMYFDSDMVLKDVRAVMPTGQGGLRFCQPQAWLPQWNLSGGLYRWRPVTLPALRDLGVRYFTWLQPEEEVDGVKLCRNGGFAYIFHEPSEKNVVQAKLNVFFDIMDAEVGHGKGCPKCNHILEWSDFKQGLYESGWMCENYSTCRQAWSDDNAMRFFCSHCQSDFCEACHAALDTQGQARTLLHAGGR
mmetsp:Transcript_118120/g.294547  ORF Transcript_118120/g.294547 Transcript_118120/m.294547 type:complete len:481 (-) Transcript_118120:153-1595(-)